jgi:hypothetical protein
MIKARKGKVKLSGSAPLLFAEFSTITMAVIEALMQKEGVDRDDAVKVLDYAYEVGVLPKKEAMKKASEGLDELCKEEEESE